MSQLFYATFRDTIPELQKLLELILNVVKNEAYSELMFDYLKVIAPSKVDQVLLDKILDEERLHYRRLKQIYTFLTNEEALADAPTFEIPETYEIGINEIFVQKIVSIDDYKKMIEQSWNIPSLKEELMIFKLDEMKHLSMLNFLQIKKDKR